MAAVTDVSICSNALVMVGAKPINSFDPSGENEGQRAPTAANLYGDIRDAMLRSHYWNFATARKILAPVVLAPSEQANLFDYTAAFALPSDWQRTLQVGQRQSPISYVQEGRRLLANVTVLPLVYIFQNKEPASYDPAFVYALELAMAAALAYPITRDKALADSKKKEAYDAWKAAKRYDGADNPPEEIMSNPLIEARFRSSIFGVR